MHNPLAVLLGAPTDDDLVNNGCRVRFVVCILSYNKLAAN
jgi:hypothetical protein